MNPKTLKLQHELKNKLMAAISMLLIASILMVSSTYAWFTLSTAPEVTGITTAVGANGNLEMALLPANGNNESQANNYGVTSGTNDSIASQAVNLANVTWGNLVDLSTYYGLEKVTLYPSAVNTTAAADGTININEGGSILKTPSYGADGRVASVNANTIAGIYDTVQEKAYKDVVIDGTRTISNPAGVRLIGTVSGMSDRQLDFSNAISYASAARSNAEGAARGALEKNGGALGNIAVKYATNSSDPYNDTDKAALVAMVNALQGETGTKGALDYIEDGLRQYIYAYQISVSDTYLTYKEAIVGGDGTAPTSSLDDLETAGLIPAGIVSIIDELETSRAAVNEAATKLDGLTGGSYAWAEISGAMSSLVNIQNLSINGEPVYKDGAINSGLKEKIMEDFMKGAGITLTMPSGSGVFADVADFVGNYGATIYVPASAVIDGSDLKIKATMSATTTNDTTYFKEANAIASETTIEKDDEEAQAISDYYGYVIDLAFRTNAADSYLKLQTEAVDRIYTDETSEEGTMGGGATMIFKSSDFANGFQEPEMEELMKHIRVVFFDPASNNKVLAYGVMDEKSIKPLGEAEISVGLKLAKTPTPATEEDYIADNTIMPLVQNTAQRLSVLVYLDGTTLTNADVAFGSETSMTGRLNLQFSSSVDLEAMKYTDFASLDGSGNSNGSESMTPVLKDVTTGTIADGYAATIKHVTVGTTYKLVAVITETASATAVDGNSGVTVTIGGQTASYTEFGALSGWVVDGTETAPTEAVDVTVTAN